MDDFCIARKLRSWQKQASKQNKTQTCVYNNKKINISNQFSTNKNEAKDTSTHKHKHVERYLKSIYIYIVTKSKVVNYISNSFFNFCMS